MPTMDGKVCVVTGATSGIGEATALELAQRGATVAVVGRDASRTAQSVDRIRARTGNPSVLPLVADLSAQKQVRDLARQIRTQHDRLDVLINNAGAIYSRRMLSPDGVELTWALNVVAPFLLTERLLDLLRTSAPSRVVNVTSAAHRTGRMRFDDLEGRRRYFGFRSYSQSKLALLLYTGELARRLEGSRVTVNAVHPGFVNSHFGRNNGAVVDGFWRVAEFLFGASPARGARTSVYLATAPELASTSGRYFRSGRVAVPSPASRDREAARRLWKILEGYASGSV